ncbi:MAG: hypothetical protein N2036_03230 [Bryobacteraceae bacterium]|nr:hypothetical protein [Bryobacteraceae bacterium]
MSLPLSAAAVARPRRRPRRKVMGRPRIEELEEDLPEEHAAPHARLAILPGDICPERAAWLELLLTDPAGARRERLEARREYWRRRVKTLEARLAAAEAELREAQEAGAPAAVWQARVVWAAAWADVEAARARLEEWKREAE